MGWGEVELGAGVEGFGNHEFDEFDEFFWKGCKVGRGIKIG